MDEWMSEGLMDGLDGHGLVTFDYPVIFMIFPDVMSAWMSEGWMDG